MRFLSLLLGAASLAAARANNNPSVSSTTASQQQELETPQTSLTFRVPATHHLNPNVLPPSTHATLSSASLNPLKRSAPLSVHNTLVFRNVTPGSYLVDVHCPTHAFQPLRLDVVWPVDAVGRHGKQLEVGVWETYRGNDWDNKGEVVPLRKDEGGGVYDVRLLGSKGYFMERSKFSIFSILRNPMILLGLVSMGIFLGMPYLVDNMDPEMRAEWEERQKTNPMNSIMGAAAGGGGASAAGPNFDMAAFLAGANKNKEESGGSSNGGGGNGGNKESRKKR